VLQVTIFPVISGSTGAEPIFDGILDFDLELLTSRTFDNHIHELTYRPVRHGNHGRSHVCGSTGCDDVTVPATRPQLCRTRTGVSPSRPRQAPRAWPRRSPLPAPDRSPPGRTDRSDRARPAPALRAQ